MARRPRPFLSPLATAGVFASITILLAATGCEPTASAKTNADDASTNPAVSTKEPKLIPRSVLFGNPQRAGGKVSPYGKWLSYLAPVDGILNVFVAPIDDIKAARQVTDDKTRDIRGYTWAYNGDYILYSQDKGGDEDWHV